MRDGGEQDGGRREADGVVRRLGTGPSNGCAGLPPGGPGGPGGHRNAGGRPPCDGSPGYSMVVLVMAIAVLNVMLAAALHTWSEMIKRDKEEELISRGFQYAEAIRVFQKRFQRWPVTLDELIKVKPRCIRQLWKDPMTDDGEWDPIYLNQGQKLHPPPPGSAAGGQVAEGLDPKQRKAAVGPIHGVRSRSGKQSLLQFFGHDHYDEWDFTVELLMHPNMLRDYRAGLILSTRWLGRPMPNFVPVGSGLPPGGPPPAFPPPGGGSGKGSGGSGTFRPGPMPPPGVASPPG
jgi:type II secretory pathway pseudopilin PulG